MKLRKTEIWAILLTLVFLAATAGYHLGARRRTPEFYVTTESRVLPAAENRSTPETGDGAEAPGETAPVNINTAGPEELKTLSGVGDKLAERIVAYREEHGAFGSVEDITQVSGIGPAVYEANRDRMTVG